MSGRDEPERRRFVLLDRDGTLIVSHHYLADPDKVELLPRVGEGLRLLRDMGLGLLVVTNQSAIGRGYFDEVRLEAIHERLSVLLAAEGVSIDGLYVCPHRPDEGCDCRKPGIGMVERAVREHGVSPTEAFVIGDNVCDVEMGEACGARTLLVTSGYGARVLEQGAVDPDHVVEDLVEAAGVIRDILGSPGVDKE